MTPLALSVPHGSRVTHDDNCHQSSQGQASSPPLLVAGLEAVKRAHGLCLSPFPERVTCAHRHRRVGSLAQEIAPPVRPASERPRTRAHPAYCAQHGRDNPEGGTRPGAGGGRSRQGAPGMGRRCWDRAATHTGTSPIVFSQMTGVNDALPQLHSRMMPV